MTKLCAEAMPYQYQANIAKSIDGRIIIKIGNLERERRKKIRTSRLNYSQFQCKTDLLNEMKQ